jgi:hypothetical protein
MRRREPPFAPLQQTNPRATMAGDLPSRPRAIILDLDQGSANSRRSSPGSGASTPLRDALNRSPPVRFPSVQLNHHHPALPPLAGEACHLDPISPRFVRARLGPLIPRNWPPVSPRLTCWGQHRAKGSCPRNRSYCATVASEPPVAHDLVSRASRFPVSGISASKTRGARWLVGHRQTPHCHTPHGVSLDSQPFELPRVLHPGSPFSAETSMPTPQEFSTAWQLATRRPSPATGQYLDVASNTLITTAPD